jgi:hypothetical protein
MDPVSAAAGALDTRVLSMQLTDVRASLAQVQQVSSPTQTADVILHLSTAAQQLLKTPPSS